MLIIDNILAAPARGLLWIFEKVHEAAEQELATSAEKITAELSELYKMLESGSISVEQFDAREKELLDQLDRLDGKDE